jgi:Zn-finger nucleic acid-binding protein
MREVAARARSGYLVLLDQCPLCDGMWMNRGELARVKRRTPLPPAAQRAALARLATSYGATSQWSKVANLDAATYAADGEDADDSPDMRALLWSTAPWIVLRALLHLLLRV